MDTGETPSATVTLRGVLMLLANPCMTQPCLPGMALAVMPRPDGGHPHPFFLTRDGAFVQGSHALPVQAAATVGEAVEVVGVSSESHDVHGERVWTIEVSRVVPREAP